MESLKSYNKKRNFEKTNEPKGKVEKSSKHIFCVQYHLARAKHYDFRLEHNGVMISFAVPKGPSLNPKDKRLAVKVEDHPVSYASFEGTIPKGEYGGGTVMLWDEGTWAALEDEDQGLKNGSLKFELFGKKLKGKWALVRLKKDNEKENWLLIKENDEFASQTKNVTKNNISVKTNRTISQIESGKTLQKQKNPFGYVSPMLAKLETTVPKGNDYAFEVKYDGYRVIGVVENGVAKLFSRNGQDYSQKFEIITQKLQTFFADKSLVVDGELIAPDIEGKSDFGALQAYLKNPEGKTLVYMVFDILALDGKDLRQKPLLERKKVLKNLLKGSPAEIQLSKHVIGHGEESFLLAQKLGLEGIVGKKFDSLYSSSRNGDWIKIKCYHRQEFVVGGYEKSDKKQGGIGALLVGYYLDKDLVFVGKVGTGIDEDEAQSLKKKFKNIVINKSPFKNPHKNSDNLVHLKPLLVVEVQYAQLTSDGLLRQASYKGIRDDKTASEVVLEQAEKSVGRVKITSPERKVFAEDDISKLDVAKYYLLVADEMLKYCSNRLLSVVRCHDNIESEKFFKKHPQKGAKCVKTKKIIGSDGEKDDYFYVDSKEGILSEVQSGTVEFHAWASKVKTLDKPDMMVFDLDPDENVKLEQLRRGALDLRNVLSQLNLKSFIKTSGGKGYHIVVPFQPSANWQVFHDFAKNVALLMEEKWPDRYTSNIRKDSRKGKIFIDYVRNARGATSVCPYSLRARKGASVSCPIRWSELGSVEPSSITMKDALKRLKKPSPWAELFLVKQKLGKIKPPKT